jgi:hypothetical protein
MNNPPCQKLASLLDQYQILEVVIEKTNPYFICHGCLCLWYKKYCLTVNDDSWKNSEDILKDSWFHIEFTDEDIDRIEQKDKLWIYLK